MVGLEAGIPKKTGQSPDPDRHQLRRLALQDACRRLSGKPRAGAQTRAGACRLLLRLPDRVPGATLHRLLHLQENQFYQSVQA